MSKKKKRNKSRQAGSSSVIEIPKEYGVFDEYLQYSPQDDPYNGPQYDIMNDCPIISEETEIVRQLPYKKLLTDTRELIRSLMEDIVTAYWQTYRQIPWREAAKKLRHTVTNGSVPSKRTIREGQ